MLEDPPPAPRPSLRWAALPAPAIILALGCLYLRLLGPARFFGCASWPYVAVAAACFAYGGARLTLEVLRRRSRVWPWVDAVLSVTAVVVTTPMLVGVLASLSRFHVMMDSVVLVRSGLQQYYALNHRYPADLEGLRRMPFFLDQRFPEPRSTCSMPFGCPHGTPRWVIRESRTVEDSGDWVYVSGPESPDLGSVYIDCTHRTAKGGPWSDF